MGDKRKDYISWDEYFMGVAKLSGMRSKDPNTQVGCCIVSQDNKILSMGYNGLPTGCSDDVFPWGREGDDPLETKYVYTVHSCPNCGAELTFHANDVDFDENTLCPNCHQPIFPEIDEDSEEETEE